MLSILILSVSCGSSNDDSQPKKKPAKIYSFVPSVEKNYPEIESYVAECLRKKQSQIDISKYHVTIEDAPRVYRSAIFTNPDIFYADASEFNYDYDSDKIVYYLYPEYIVMKSEIPSYIVKFDKAVDSFLKDIDDNLSDFDKALLIHDKLITGCEYQSGGSLVYTAYGAIVNGEAVCEGYSRAYSYLLLKAGISNKCLDNAKESHCWNCVKLDDKWYHADVTSDDPTPDTSGYVSHKYFLVSDSKLSSYKSEKHEGYKKDITYNSDYKCVSKTYDSSFFRNILSAFYIKNNGYYFIDNNYQGKNYSAFILRKDDKNEVVETIKDTWRSDKNEEYVKSFSKLCYLDGYFFYNSAKSIFSYNVNNRKLKNEYTLPKDCAKDFYGVTTCGNYILADKKNSPTESSQKEKILCVNKDKTISVVS